MPCHPDRVRRNYDTPPKWERPVAVVRIPRRLLFARVLISAEEIKASVNNTPKDARWYDLW